VRSPSLFQSRLEDIPLSLKRKFKQIRDNYVIGQVARLSLPDFPDEPPCRLRVHFSGRVQKVGFRLEVCELAARLSLTGFCRNLEDGSVLAEFQGPRSKIDFLLAFMESLKRIRITHKTVEKLPVLPEEIGFARR